MKICKTLSPRPGQRPSSIAIVLRAATVLLFFSQARAHVEAPQVIEDMRTAIAALRVSFSESQATKAEMDFNDDERHQWAYVPKDRRGVPLKDLTAKQRQLVHGFLDTVLSDSGHAKARNVIALEGVLFALEGAPHRDVELYFLSLFGEPEGEGPWGVRFEGHHLSLNFTIVGDRLLATAPHFWGANPAEVRSGSEELLGLRTLRLEEDLARELLLSLSAPQRREAVFQESAYRDIVTKAEPSVSPLDLAGIKAGSLDLQQNNLLKRIIRVYLDNMETTVAQARFERLEKEAFEDIRFGWAGGLEPGQGHYYRIQGRSFLIEYDNVQGGANHIHAVWRDFDGDFGRDILKEHYQSGGHPR